MNEDIYPGAEDHPSKKQPNIPPRVIGAQECSLCKQSAQLWQALTDAGPVKFIRCPRCDAGEDKKP